MIGNKLMKQRDLEGRGKQSDHSNSSEFFVFLNLRYWSFENNATESENNMFPSIN